MKRVIFIIVLILIAAAFLVGYWPEHRQLVDEQSRTAQLQARVDAAQAKVRLGEVLGQLLVVRDAVAAQNYGTAATAASTYFDRVRDEAARADQPPIKDVLNGIQRSRDNVTAAIARADPGVADTLRQQEMALRGALGYKVEPPAPATTPATAP